MHRLISFAIASALAAISLANAAPAAPTAPPPSITPSRLPRSAKPTHYYLAVVPNASAPTFEGQVLISVDLAFTSVRLRAVAGEAERAALRSTKDEAAQTATFAFSKPLAPGRYLPSTDRPRASLLQCTFASIGSGS